MARGPSNVWTLFELLFCKSKQKQCSDSRDFSEKQIKREKEARFEKKQYLTGNGFSVSVIWEEKGKTQESLVLVERNLRLNLFLSESTH